MAAERDSQGLPLDSGVPSSVADAPVADLEVQQGVQKGRAKRVGAARNTNTRAARKTNPCFGASIGMKLIPVSHYAVTLPFTPSSHVQMRRYAEHFAHKLVFNYKANPPSVTFDDDAIRTLRGRYPKDPLYPLVGTHREYEKLNGTYLKRIVPQADGRYREDVLHTPKTLRLAMKVLQLLPRSDEPDSLYSRVRSLFRAAPGKVLFKRDFSGIEAVLVAYLAGDQNLFRLAGGEIQDLHGYIATTALKRPPDLTWSDSDIRDYLKGFRKEGERQWDVNGTMKSYDALRTGCKRAAYLSFYLGTPPRMVQAEPDIFPTRAVAAWYQDLFFATFPKVRAWQWAVCVEAEEKGFTTSPDGFRQYFPEGVFRYEFDKGTRKWTKKLGEVSKEVVASKPQHMGFMFSADAMIRLAQDETMAETMRLSIHDEILGEGGVDVVDCALVAYQRAMEQPMVNLPLPKDWGVGSHVIVRTEGARSGEGGTWDSMKKCA